MEQQLDPPNSDKMRLPGYTGERIIQQIDEPTFNRIQYTSGCNACERQTSKRSHLPVSDQLQVRSEFVRMTTATSNKETTYGNIDLRVGRALETPLITK